MPSSLRRIDDPHDAPIAPDIVPAEWADCVAQKPVSDAISREKLFAEIRHAAETAAPAVDATFRASDVNDIPALKSRSSRAWIKRAVTAFLLALVSAITAAAWKHHGDAATQAAASWVPMLSASSAPATDTPAGQTDAAAQPAADAPAAAQPAEQTASSAPALPAETEQQIQSMARDLAAMGQQIEQLKASIEALKAQQQAAVAPAPPAARAPAPAPKPKVTALPKPPPIHSPRAAYPPAMQAAAVPPPAQPAYPPPQPYAPPPQATMQPNGEPVVRPPMPMPLSDRY